MFHPFVFRAELPEGATSIRVAYLDNDSVEIEAYGAQGALVARAQYDYDAPTMEWRNSPQYPWSPNINCSLN